MHDRPTAPELLADIADLLEGDVIAALDGGLKHQVRVAANLCRIVERELRLAPAYEAAEVEALATLLGTGADADVAGLHAALVDRIQAGDADPEQTRRVLLGITRDKLAVVKPGHADHDFAGEGIS